MSRLSEIFRKNERCFIPFVTAGHPDLEATREIVVELDRAGADIVEIGIPFSDPVADGPVIQQSSFQALKHGHTMSDYLELVRRLRAEIDTGLVFMTYLNPALQFGLKRLDREAAEAGLDGVLISDLTPDEYRRLHRFERLDTVFLAAPTSSDERLERVAEASSGFVYLVARTGVTGEQTDVEALVPDTVARLRRFTDLPIAVGFGITSHRDMLRVWEHAEGAVVGSAIVAFIEGCQDRASLARQVGDYVRKHLISALESA